MGNQRVDKSKAYLLAVHLKSQDINRTLAALDEVRSLAETMNFEVVGQEIQSRDAYDSKTYIGTGKLIEMRRIVEDQDISLVLFDHELTPNQGKFLEKQLGCMVLDRTQLILEIFANHAQTPEAKEQVELAQLKYMLPRLVGLWAHLDREKGGIGLSKGTGEKQINIDRTIIRKRISKLEKSLGKIARERQTQSNLRKKCFLSCVVGYTNAGKTSLVNQLTGAGLYIENKLFATLDSATRVMDNHTKPKILLSDTVGFIDNLPHSLIASFRSTLSVVKEADLLLHVIDASNPDIDKVIETTTEVLREIGAANIPLLIVLNKIDLVEDQVEMLVLKKKFPEAVMVSALDIQSVQRFKKEVSGFFERNLKSERTLLPYERSSLLSKFYQLGMVEKIDYEDEGIYITHKMTPTNQKILAASLLETANR
ncbi:MAG: GTPase HflX [Deltaproteobacteria bacterium]|nr:GTPase HflX [Deltaproteobacteria bacterium]